MVQRGGAYSAELSPHPRSSGTQCRWERGCEQVTDLDPGCVGPGTGRLILSPGNPICIDLENEGAVKGALSFQIIKILSLGAEPPVPLGLARNCI